jgi:3-hydroxyacyl-CoA dehydrogenase
MPPRSSMIHYEISDSVALVTIDNPPVNALGPGVLEGIEAAIQRGIDDPSVRAFVLVGAGGTFVAGADINIFRTLSTRQQSLERSEAFQASLKRIEARSKPIVAAIHGNALGGGLELAMACHYRLAVSTASVGQPEVLLGLIPGAGGTERLPRLCGVPLALEICINGRPLPATRAHAAGIIDELVDGNRDALVATAAARARALAESGEIRRTCDLSAAADVRAGIAACDERRAQLEDKPTPVLAPYAAIDAIKAAVTLPFDAGSAVERELFADCLMSTESRALVHLFFAEREAAKVPGVPRDTPAREVRRAAIVGAGAMGRGIAMTYAAAGIPVLLKDMNEGAVARGMATIRDNFEEAIAKERITAGAADRLMGLITPTTTFDRFAEVDIVVEAVFEEPALKTAVFADLGRVTRPDAVLASTTSTVDIDALARASGYESRVIGHHFFSPANDTKFLEIVRGEATAPETIATSQKLAKRLGKVAVVVGNCAGFAANRMLSQYLREIRFLLEEGASGAQIDRVMTRFGMPAGLSGMKDRTDGDGTARRDVFDAVVSDEEVLSRTTAALANEGARLLEEGQVSRASDIDVICCYGFGFPRYRGGPMFYADTVAAAGRRFYSTPV